MQRYYYYHAIAASDQKRSWNKFPGRCIRLHYHLKKELGFHVKTKLEIGYPLQQDGKIDPRQKDFTDVSSGPIEGSSTIIYRIFETLSRQEGSEMQFTRESTKLSIF